MTTNELRAPDDAAASRARRTWTGVPARWPTALAVGMTVASLDGGDTDSTVEGFGEALPLLALGYLVLAKTQRRRASWLMLLTALATMTVLRALDVVSPVTDGTAIHEGGRRRELRHGGGVARESSVSGGEGPGRG